ncbi:proteasomal ATPase-associated factor 1 [Metschnikowia aff. pulcherrima]|uniref:Proteasomal ATPase-associated factor 1 n=1 Tax=Metschnikowia aff. pulcherrima TaxID=2163413 RepID=A0A4P6XM97_9ASCO|nr:proteasomal ATPase-associated factor 1 [Metschnikowia aff. pulcherrima]
MHIITIQESFLDVIQDVEAGKVTQENIWVARRDTSNEEHQEYYDVTVLMKEGKLAFISDTAAASYLKFQQNGHRQFTVDIADELGSHVYHLRFSDSKLNLGLRGSKISTSAILPDGTRLLIGTDAGHIMQYDTTTARLVSEIKNAHLADILQIVVLPSSQVMMSVGLDLQTKLWPVTSGAVSLPVRVFLAQKGQITDIAIIDRGRNFLTASVDGSVDLWECSTAQVVSEFRRIGGLKDPVTCIALAEGLPVKPELTVGGDLLHGCSKSLVFVGYKLGTIQQYSVAGHFQTGTRFQRPVAVTLLHVEGGYLVSGYADGLLRVYEMKLNQETKKGQSEDLTHSYYDLQLNPNFPIEHASVSSKKQGLSIVVSNGPELLLQVDFDGADFCYTQLVGLSELFRIVLIEKNGSNLYVATENDIAQY